MSIDDSNWQLPYYALLGLGFRPQVSFLPEEAIYEVEVETSDDGQVQTGMSGTGHTLAGACFDLYEQLREEMFVEPGEIAAEELDENTREWPNYPVEQRYRRVPQPGSSVLKWEPLD